MQPFKILQAIALACAFALSGCASHSTFPAASTSRKADPGIPIQVKVPRSLKSSVKNGTSLDPLMMSLLKDEKVLARDDTGAWIGIGEWTLFGLRNKGPFVSPLSSWAVGKSERDRAIVKGTIIFRRAPVIAPCPLVEIPLKQTYSDCRLRVEIQFED